jgi:hypothetical protein
MADVMRRWGCNDPITFKRNMRQAGFNAATVLQHMASTPELLSACRTGVMHPLVSRPPWLR